jgi:RsiW-degrading membrane proteinase PrsW (M82 family)
METALALTLALLPALLLLRYFVRADRFPEPTRVVLITFGLGCAIIAPVIPVALGLIWLLPESLPAPLAGALVAFVGAAIPEEGFKWLVLRRYCLTHSAFDEPMDGLVYGAAAGLGFAALENVIYVASGGVVVAVARGLTAVPMHAALGVVMGEYFGRARFAEGAARRRLLWRAWLVPMALHGLYDLPLLAMDRGLGESADLLLLCSVPAVLLFVLIVARRVHRKFLAAQHRVVRKQRLAGAS